MDPRQKQERVDRALGRLSPHEHHCLLCPRECGADRAAGETGWCGIGSRAVPARGLLHYGEEPPLSGVSDIRREGTDRKSPRRGSGTIFFSGCGLRCVFCQNHQLSWSRRGRPVSDDELAGMMLDLQHQGAYNINLVTPGHVLLPVLRALRLALDRGLVLPLVYNCGGYEKESIIRELEGIVDIYLPDLKYRSAEASTRFSSAPDYFRHASQAVREMFRQRPRLILDAEGIAREGLILRHLVLPNHVSDSLALLDWIAAELGTSVCLSLMGQFRPVFRAPEDLRRTLTAEEYGTVLERAETLGFEDVYVQPESLEGDEHLVPDFDRESPFPWSDDTKT